jgi:hypothetical protein
MKIKGEPLTLEKEKDVTVHCLDEFRKTGGYLSSDVESAVRLMKGHISVVDEARKDLLYHTFKTKEILDIIDFCFPVFKKEG